MSMFSIFNTQKKLRYATTEKAVGETPLVAAERLRNELHLPTTTPLAYAGRLDPMASGKLLILIGDECKVQEKYHAYDKEYEVELLLGVTSDTGDVLGHITVGAETHFSQDQIEKVFSDTVGPIALPYPHFSSKTVGGKPLHVWTLENRLHEIEIPIKQSVVYRLVCTGIRTISKTEILKTVRVKIETIPEVTDTKKVLGANFRRNEVREAWDTFAQEGQDEYQLISFVCIASSGTYMRSLVSHIAHDLGTCGLAYSIHRTKIGTFRSVTKKCGLWITQF